MHELWDDESRAGQDTAMTTVRRSHRLWLSNWVRRVARSANWALDQAMCRCAMQFLVGITQNSTHGDTRKEMIRFGLIGVVSRPVQVATPVLLTASS